MTDIAYLNGTFLPLAEARVSIEDRGFQFGDGIYEVIRTYRGRPFELPAHLSRLAASARAIQLTLPEPAPRLADLVGEGIQRAGFTEAKIYLQVTRGVAPRDHAFPPSVSPTCVMTFRPLHPLDPSLSTHGVGAITMEDVRWARCDVKSLNLLGNVLARQRALECGAFETLFVKDGVLTEGSVSNVMIVHQGALHTAPLGPSILAGITRQVVMDLARKTGMVVQEQAFPCEALRSATEIFLTGTTVEILPVVRVDGTPVGGGSPGPVTTELARRFHEVTRA